MSCVPSFWRDEEEAKVREKERERESVCVCVFVDKELTLSMVLFHSVSALHLLVGPRW